jgi:hypothetical protein
MHLTPALPVDVLSASNLVKNVLAWSAAIALKIVANLKTVLPRPRIIHLWPGCVVV